MMSMERSLRRQSGRNCAQLFSLMLTIYERLFGTRQ
jgi:hypothetical protein